MFNVFYLYFLPSLTLITLLINESPISLLYYTGRTNPENFFMVRITIAKQNNISKTLPLVASAERVKFRSLLTSLEYNTEFYYSAFKFLLEC